MQLDVIQNDVWYEQGLRFTCAQCGNCCTGGPGYVWISKEEIGRLAEFLKLPRERVSEQYCRPIGDKWSLKEIVRAGQYDCVFLKEVRVAGKDGEVMQSKRVCEIYPVRPLQCRTWPFWEGVLATK